jgi:hypothetical protein
MPDLEAIQDAIAEYLRYAELGGDRPALDHLSEHDRAAVVRMIDMLELSRGVRLDVGAEPQPVRRDQPAGTGLMSDLRPALPPDATVAVDPVVFELAAPSGRSILGGWSVGTFGGRVRVWLVDADAASEVERDRSLLGYLDRAFRVLPDTAAIALVSRDGMCMVVEPSDCAPAVDVPTGSIAARGYRRRAQPVAEAVAGFLRELSPPWDPIGAFEPGDGSSLDSTAVAADHATAAIAALHKSGARSRQPKKDVLTALGDRESQRLAEIAAGLLEGRRGPEDAVRELEDLAGPP